MIDLRSTQLFTYLLAIALFSSSGLELSATTSLGCFVDRLISVGTENLPVFKIIFRCLTRHGDIVSCSCSSNATVPP